MFDFLEYVTLEVGYQISIMYSVRVQRASEPAIELFVVWVLKHAFRSASIPFSSHSSQYRCRSYGVWHFLQCGNYRIYAAQLGMLISELQQWPPHLNQRSSSDFQEVATSEVCSVWQLTGKGFVGGVFPSKCNITGPPPPKGISYVALRRIDIFL